MSIVSRTAEASYQSYNAYFHGLNSCWRWRLWGLSYVRSGTPNACWLLSCQSSDVNVRSRSPREYSRDLCVRKSWVNQLVLVNDRRSTETRCRADFFSSVPFYDILWHLCVEWTTGYAADGSWRFIIDSNLCWVCIRFCILSCRSVEFWTLNGDAYWLLIWTLDKETGRGSSFTMAAGPIAERNQGKNYDGCTSTNSKECVCLILRKYLFYCHVLDATVYVGGLDEKVSEAILWELFVQAGPVGEYFPSCYGIFGLPHKMAVLCRYSFNILLPFS